MLSDQYGLESPQDIVKRKLPHYSKRRGSSVVPPVRPGLNLIYLEGRGFTKTQV